MAANVRALVERFRLSPHDLAALRKSAVLSLWLKKTASAWVVGIAYSVFAHWIFPALMRPLLRVVWPPNKGHGLQALQSFLNNSLVEDPRVDHTLGYLAPVVWLLGFSLVVALLEIKVRPAIDAARDRSRTLENEADAKIARNPAESILLLRRAMDFAVDAPREAELRGKLAELDVRLSRDGAGNAPTVPPPSSGAAAPAAGATITPSGVPARRIGVRGRYRLDAELARGGMGVVWRAFDTVLERPVAVKELPPTTDPSLKDRFRQEALALARLSHANVVQVYDFVE
ncbi:MAG TPA: hypothetical protein VMV18_00025, partial [bacterium]|nr:hypothetical protein [bacterium]